MQLPRFSFSLSKLILTILLIVIFELVTFNYLDQWVDGYTERSSRKQASVYATQASKAVTSYRIIPGELDQYNKSPKRTFLQRLTSGDSKVREIDLINKNNEIVLSNIIAHEDSALVHLTDLKWMGITEATIIEDTIIAGRGTFEIVTPYLLDNESIGVLRMQVEHADFADMDELKNTIKWMAGFIIALITLIAVGIGSVIFDRRSPEPRSRPVRAEQPYTEPDEEPQSEDVESKTFFGQLTKIYRSGDALEKSFQQTEREMTSLMRELNQGVLILDMDMNVITLNQYLIDVLKIKSKVRARERVYDILNKNPKMIEIYRRAKDPLTHDVKQNMPINLLNGKKIQAEILASSFYTDDTIGGVVFYMKNIQMLEELEHTLQRSMKYGVISQLAASIGHEVRNPLSSLAIHTEIVDNMVEKSVDDVDRKAKIKKSIAILNSEVERLHKLIDQFFNLAKSQGSGLVVENVNDVMQEVLDLVQQQAFETNVNITTSFAPDLPMVKMSKHEMKQVIINLILNGFDALPEGGELSLKTRFREGNVVIRIKDSGKGIPEDIRDHIFDLYFSTKETGGGIGLAISRNIVEAHEGRLYFETEPGNGTIFYIELPTSQN